MKKGLIFTGIIVAVFLMPVAVSAKKPSFNGWQKNGKGFEEQNKGWQNLNQNQIVMVQKFVKIPALSGQ